MDRYVAFLRGMNIGGRRIKNEELRREFEELGLSDVSCFRASGNVIFAADEDDEHIRAPSVDDRTGGEPASTGRRRLPTCASGYQR